jgi:REP element-mobilizing transposase RayT
MKRRDHLDFQSRTEPIAFLITFRTYGTWLHGEERGSIDRRLYNRYGTAAMPANARLLEEEKRALRHAPVILNHQQREVVEFAIQEVCEQRNYTLHAVNARSNHVHSVVSSPHKPERLLSSFKSYATRKLREHHLLNENVKPWARHGSTPYLWTEEQLLSAIDYVLHGQGDKPFRSKE